MMPLDDLFDNDVRTPTVSNPQKYLCETYGIVRNPFPSSGQTSGHPHKDLPADREVDAAVKSFYMDRASHVLCVTATQGVGKTNLLNAYETALRDKLEGRAFFVIRYIQDPDPAFERLIRSVFENLGEQHLRRVAANLAQRSKAEVDTALNGVRSIEIQRMFRALMEAARNHTTDQLAQRAQLANEWLLGLPVKKAHRDELGVQFRIDTVESKTRVLRDVVYFSASLKTLEGIFLLVDELEKADNSQSKTIVLRFLSALRALIDALPKYMFLMVAVTPDALSRYREMLPALRGRLSNEIRLQPLGSLEEAIELWAFYMAQARREASLRADLDNWRVGKTDIVTAEDVNRIFGSLAGKTSIHGVRQRDFLNALHSQATDTISNIL